MFWNHIHVEFIFNFMITILNNYSPKLKLILLNNNDYSTILTESEVNNCFSIFTRGDLNRIREETIKKRLV